MNATMLRPARRLLLTGRGRPRYIQTPLRPMTARRQASSLRNYFQELANAGRATYKSSPFMFPVGLTLVVGTIGMLCYATYYSAKVRMQMGNYPENVAIKLRRARYFVSYDPDIARAMKAYLGAIHLAREAGMAALGDDVLGIWIEMAHVLETNGAHKDSIEILENTRKDCLQWIDEHGDEEGMAVHRTRLLQKSIQLAHKIAEMYSGIYYPNQAKAEESLVWAVETSLKENERRQKEGLQPGEGGYFTLDQQGAQLEALGHHYEDKDNHFYASQLFLQALMLKQKQDCHSAILMNNLAASIVQQTPPPEPDQPPPSAEQLRDSGRAWAKKALEVARTIKPPERTSECDEGCAVATHNLGEFAEMDGNIRQAREYYEEAYSLAHAIEFEEGMAAAAGGLQRLSGTKSSVKQLKKR